MNAWEAEPDRDEFESSGLPCLLLREPHTGAWCGFVAVPLDHPLHGKRGDVLVKAPASFAGRTLDPYRIARADLRSDLPAIVQAGDVLPLSALLPVHGGIWSTDVMAGDPPRWRFGFRCSHATDYLPRDINVDVLRTTTADDYRSHDYAKAEVIDLAAQLAALERVELAVQETGRKN